MTLVASPLRVPLTTERLIVRMFRPGDWRDLLEYLSLHETYLFEPGAPIDAPQARRLAEERSRGTAFRAIELRDEGKLVGHLWFEAVEPIHLRTWELGFIVHPRYQRRGIATEASRALVEHAFAHMAAHRVVAQCHPRNVASWRVLEKAGFEREGHLRLNTWFHRDESGQPIWQDTLLYGRVNPAPDG